MIPENIASKIKLRFGGHWIWTGALTEGGYGQIRRKGVTLYVHRVVWEALRGPIPKGHELHHTCDFKACCNPDCLVLKINRADHSREHRRNLDIDEIIRLREQGLSLRQIGTRFDIDHHQISLRLRELGLSTWSKAGRKPK